MTGTTGGSQPQQAAAQQPGGVAGRAKQTVAGLSRALPPKRAQALRDGARAAKVLVTGRGTPPSRLVRATVSAPGGRTNGVGVGRAVGPKVPRPDLPDIDWVPAPDIATYGVIDSLYPRGGDPIAFDVELLDSLNAEYAPKKVVANPPSYGGSVLDTAARRRVIWADRMVGLRGQRVLEIGCGSALEVWNMAHNLGSDAVGVDVIEYGTWQHLRDEHVDLRMVDLTYDNPFEPESFDRIVSFTVWEHIPRPYAMLERAYDLLKPGGLMWMRVNLFAGPQASHRYKDIHFPWPHLLFSDDVVRAWDGSHGRVPRSFAWVNRLSFRHYEDYLLRVGFRIRELGFTQTPIDEAFYARFEDMLGRYPRWDLETDYFLAVLEKPAR